MFKALLFAFGIFVGMTIANGWRDWVDIAKTKTREVIGNDNVVEDIKNKCKDTKTFFFPPDEEKEVQINTNQNFEVDNKTLLEAEQFAKKYNISIIKALQILKDQKE